jgi:hypothetical protein
MTVIAWGGDGASGGWLTWPLPGEVASKGSPAATDERCVLDEHIACEANAQGLIARKAKCIEAERNGRGQKSPAGRGSRATY